MRLKFFFTLFFTCIYASTAWNQTSNPDSTAFIMAVTKLTNDLRKIERAMYLQRSDQSAMQDSLNTWNYSIYEQQNKIIEVVVENKQQTDSALAFMAALKQESNAMMLKQKRNNLVSYILHGFTLTLIVFLIIFVLIQRQKSLDFLLSRTNNLSGQNEEILAKAEELKKIKKSLKDIIKNQQQAEKGKKKSKKK